MPDTSLAASPACSFAPGAPGEPGEATASVASPAAFFPLAPTPLKKRPTLAGAPATVSTGFAAMWATALAFLAPAAPSDLAKTSPLLTSSSLMRAAISPTRTSSISRLGASKSPKSEWSVNAVI